MQKIIFTERPHIISLAEFCRFNVRNTSERNKTVEVPYAIPYTSAIEFNDLIRRACDEYSHLIDGFINNGHIFSVDNQGPVLPNGHNKSL